MASEDSIALVETSHKEVFGARSPLLSSPSSSSLFNSLSIILVIVPQSPVIGSGPPARLVVILD